MKTLQLIDMTVADEEVAEEVVKAIKTLIL